MGSPGSRGCAHIAGWAPCCNPRAHRCFAPRNGVSVRAGGGGERECGLIAVIRQRMEVFNRNKFSFAPIMSLTTLPWRQSSVPGLCGGSLTIMQQSLGHNFGLLVSADKSGLLLCQRDVRSRSGFYQLTGNRFYDSIYMRIHHLFSLCLLRCDDVELHLGHHLCCTTCNGSELNDTKWSRWARSLRNPPCKSVSCKRRISPPPQTSQVTWPPWFSAPMCCTIKEAG